jgi:hypothetical protein
MSLFERINNKIKDDLIIEMNKTGDDDPWDDKDTKTENKKKANKNKKFNNKKEKIESGTYNYNKNKKLNQELSQRRTAQDKAEQIFSRQYDAYDDGDLGNPSQSKTQTTTQKTPSKNRAPRKGVDYFFDADKAKKEREAFRQGRKAYTDSKSGIKAGKVTDKGVIDYITKARNMSQGTNANTKANREAAKVIAKSSGSEYKEKIRTKYETDKDLARKRPSNAKSLEQIKKEIDSRPPDGRTTRTKTKVKTPKRIETSVTDKEIQDLIKKGQQSTLKPEKIGFGARDKAIKDIDDLLIGEKPGEKEFTKKALRKQQRIVTKRITTPSKKEIEQSQKIIDKNKPKTSTQNLFDITGKKKKKLKTQQVNFDKFMKNLKLKSPPKTTGLYDPLKNKIPKLEPLKPLRIPKLKPSVVTKTATKTKLFPKVMKAVAKNPKTALAVGLLGLGTYGSIKNRIATNKLKKNKMLPPVSGGGNTVTTKPRDIELFLRTDSSRK